LQPIAVWKENNDIANHYSRYTADYGTQNPCITIWHITIRPHLWEFPDLAICRIVKISGDPLKRRIQTKNTPESRETWSGVDCNRERVPEIDFGIMVR